MQNATFLGLPNLRRLGYAYCIMVYNFNELLAHWTARELADALAVPYSTAQSIKRRGSVAPVYWAKLIKSAETKALPVTSSMLIKFADKRKVSSERVAD